MADDKTARLLREWELTVRREKSLKRDLDEITSRMYKARDELGEWLAPKDAAMNEVFSIWVHGRMLCVKVLDNTLKAFRVEWRVK